MRQMQDNELFLSGMEGKEARNCVIDICRKSMADADGKVIIGNGFPDCEKKGREQAASVAGDEYSFKAETERIGNTCRELLP